MPGLTRAAFTEESAEVEVLLANMDKLKTLTRKIQGSLQRLETSGQSVQNAIKPIYGNTARLQTTNNNIDRINEAIDKIKQPLDFRQREEPIIRPGIQRTGLGEYVASMERTQQVLSEVKHSNIRSNQQVITELNDLLQYGTQELEAMFRETLSSESKPIEPLHFITKKIPFPAISSEHVSKLRSINQFAHSKDSPEGPTAKTTAIYVEVRGPYVKTTLQNLATASVGTVKKADPNAIYRQGTSGLGTYCDAIEGLFGAELDNTREIFTPEQWPQLHTGVCQEALKDFSRTLRELHTHIKNNPVTDCFLAYEVIERVSSLGARLDSRNKALRKPIVEALRPIHETATTSLYRLLEDTRTRVQNTQALPQDGAPIPITSETMTRLQTMTAYLPSISAILDSLGDGGWRTANPTNPTSPPAPMIKPFDPTSRALFSSYLADTLDALLTPLEARSRALHRSKSAQGVLLSNTIAEINRALASSPDLSAALSDPTRARLDTWRKKGQNLYLDAWREPSLHLRDVQFTNRSSGPAAGGAAQDSAAIVKALSGKERDAIKDKFRSFNASFEELVARHRTFRMEREVRPALAKEVQGLIEPLYARFWDRYYEVDKGKGKYVKFDKQGLAAVLAGLA